MGQDNSPLLLKCLNWKGRIWACRGTTYPIFKEQRLPFLTHLLWQLISPPLPRGDLFYMQSFHNSLSGPRNCSVDKGTCSWRNPSTELEGPTNVLAQTWSPGKLHRNPEPRALQRVWKRSAGFLQAAALLLPPLDTNSSPDLVSLKLYSLRQS